MELEKLALNPRAGTAWEALDLGAAIARRWWLPIARVWLAVYLPAAILIGLVFFQKLWIGALILWWIKPVFERFLLHVISRTIFGDTPTVKQTLAAWREILSPGLLRQLTIGRLSPYRSFTMPVYQLERQSGRDARQRNDVLGRRASGTAAWNTVTCAHFEGVLIASLGILVSMFSPDNIHSVEDDLREEQEDWWEIGLSDFIFFAIGASAIAPLYIASGFALYLHRRTLLEGWDIELGLRRIQTRLTERARGAVNSVLAISLGSVIALGALQPHRAWAADEAPREPKSVINEILTAPEFGEYTMEKSWQRKPSKEKEAPETNPRLGQGWLDFLASLGGILRALVWLALALAIIAVLWWARQFLVRGEVVSAAPYEAPDQLFGLDVRPETLPDDIVAAARRLLDAGRVRDALSLLYRGALSALVHRHAVELGAGDTEGDTLRAARRALTPDSGDYFAQLVTMWQATAYAARVPTPEHAQQVTALWGQHFAVKVSPATTREASA